MKTTQLLTAAGILALTGPLFAQWAPDRHPMYDSASPTTEEKMEAHPLKLSVCVARDARIVASYSEADETAVREGGLLIDGHGIDQTFAPFAKDATKIYLRGWRGERVNAQLAVRSSGPAPQLTVTATDANLVRKLPGPVRTTSMPVQTSMIRYTHAHGVPTADIIGRENSCDHPGGHIRPVWVQIDIPQDATAGAYHASVTIKAVGAEPVSLPVTLFVEPEVLPEPSQWKVHADFWQHPHAVARWHDVEPWSPEHLALMKPLMQRLAAAGQKVITCAIIDEAWNGQTYDWFPSQIQWIRGKDGVMRYDYSHFDTWVKFMMEEVGIREDIFCYTMVPWSMKVRYYDETDGTYKHLQLNHEKPEYELIWGHFLSDFRAHLKERGWLERTSIALDERPDALVRAAAHVMRTYAPELKIASSVDRPTKESAGVYLLSPVLTHAGSVTPEMLTERRAKGFKTIYYTCLHPKKPNTFTMSPPAEAEWLGYFAAAQNLDGYSRWAYNSWSRNPFETTDFGNWPSGDCFLVYPGNLSSVRFERLRDGLEEFEKIAILRAQADKSPEVREAVEQMNRDLRDIFTVERSKGNEHTQDVRKARDIIRKTAEKLR